MAASSTSSRPSRIPESVGSTRISGLTPIRDPRFGRLSYLLPREEAPICSSVYRDFRIGPFDSEDSLSTNGWLENPGAGQRTRL
jgi:hypothetical protein